MAINGLMGGLEQLMAKMGMSKSTPVSDPGFLANIPGGPQNETTVPRSQGGWGTGGGATSGSWGKPTGNNMDWLRRIAEGMGNRAAGGMTARPTPTNIDPGFNMTPGDMQQMGRIDPRIPAEAYRNIAGPQSQPSQPSGPFNASGQRIRPWQPGDPTFGGKKSITKGKK